MQGSEGGKCGRWTTTIPAMTSSKDRKWWLNTGIAIFGQLMTATTFTGIGRWEHLRIGFFYGLVNHTGHRKIRMWI